MIHFFQIREAFSRNTSSSQRQGINLPASQKSYQQEMSSSQQRRNNFSSSQKSRNQPDYQLRTGFTSTPSSYSYSKHTKCNVKSFLESIRVNLNPLFFYRLSSSQYFPHEARNWRKRNYILLAMLLNFFKISFCLRSGRIHLFRLVSVTAKLENEKKRLDWSYLCFYV